MLAKTSIFVLCVAASLAYPTNEKESIPNGPISTHVAPQTLTFEPIKSSLPPQPLPPQPHAVGPVDVIPTEDLIPEGTPKGTIRPGAEGVKPDNSDLKTDNSFWYGRSYYPVYYRRSYYPRSYSYYSYYPTYYSSWW